MSVLQFDMCKKLRKAFSDFEREAQQEQARKDAEAAKYREAARHTPDTPEAA